MKSEGTVLAAGQVTPAPDGPRVEQVGWGVARALLHRCQGGSEQAPLLLRTLPGLAEHPGHAAYAVFVGREVVAVAAVELTLPEARYLGSVLVPDAPDGAGQALLVRALHDVGAAGGSRLRVPAHVPHLAGFEVVSDR